MKLSLLTAIQHPAFRDSESDGITASEQANMEEFVKAKRSGLRNGLTRRHSSGRNWLDSMTKMPPFLPDIP
jgi:hypothetical protein